MGTSMSFSRFIGLQIPEETYRKLEALDKINIKIYAHSCQEGCEPHWVIAPTAMSVCEMSRAHWDGHGGGAEDFDYCQDPLSNKRQEKANAHDVVILKEIVKMFDNLGLAHGEIVNVLGWVDSWYEQDLNFKIKMSQQVVCHGPWVVNSANNDHPDELVTNAYYSPYEGPADKIIELPYGKELGPKHPAIPVRGFHESQAVYNKSQRETTEYWNQTLDQAFARLKRNGLI